MRRLPLSLRQPLNRTFWPRSPFPTCADMWASPARGRAFSGHAAAASSSDAQEVVIAMGSNLGDRAQHLLQALHSLKEQGVQVVRHSALYETVPAYVVDQPSFLNAACLAHTHLPPLELLATLKRIEAAAGRDLQGGVRFGPRPLDLDIIFYGGLDLDEGKLQVPHPRWRERSFVKAPVADLYRPPAASHHSKAAGQQHSGQASDECSTSTAQAAQSRVGEGSQGGAALTHRLAEVHRLWTQGQGSAAATSSGCGLKSNESQGLNSKAGQGPGLPSGEGEVMRRVMPLPRGRQLAWGDRTHLMAILNVTPDSFSDGGQLLAGGLEGAVGQARRLVHEGAGVLDVGGQSTRPGAVRLTAQDEAARVVPFIRALRQDPGLRDVVISVDTFYASVAREAVEAGADIVNDVSGGTLDPGMFEQVAQLGVPYVLMHMRGDPTTMQAPSNLHYDCVWRDVGHALQARADEAMACGIAAWNLVLDPGVGFSKTVQGNLELIRHLADMKAHALHGPFQQGPLLVGPSRKGFLGRLTGREQAAERDAATVACAVACVAGGGLADIVRVHNVRDTRDGLIVADALYR